MKQRDIVKVSMNPRCINCGRRLTDTEMTYYGMNCERCEKKIQKVLDEKDWFSRLCKFFSKILNFLRLEDEEDE